MTHRSVTAFVAQLFCCHARLAAQETPIEQTVEFSVEELFVVSDRVARKQTFIANARSFESLEFLVRPDAPGVLIVDVRSTDLRQLFGRGRIDAQESGLMWRDVEWEKEPAMTPDASYALVVYLPRGTAAGNRWAIGVTPFDMYPWGTGPSFTYRRASCSPQKHGGCVMQLASRSKVDGIDLAFRATFSNGDEVSMPLRVDTTPRLQSFPEKASIALRVNEGGPAVGICVDDICADPSKNLVGDSAARQVRAATTGETCGEFRTRAAPALGYSCNDSCRAHGFDGCVATVWNRYAVCVEHEYSKFRSCRRPIADSKRNPHCLCSGAIRFSLDGRSRARRALRAGPYLVTPRDEGADLVDPATGAVRSLKLRQSGRGIQVAGAVVFRRSRAVSTIGPRGRVFERSVPECEYDFLIRYESGPWLACFRDDRLTLHSLLAEREVEPPVAPEFFHHGAPFGVGEWLYYPGGLRLFRWRPGEASWSEVGEPVPSRWAPSKRVGKLLTRIYADSPDYPGFVGDRFHHRTGWMFDVGEQQFYRHGLTGERDMEATNDVVRYGKYLFDERSQTFRRTDASGRWVGRRIVVSLEECPERHHCEPLKPPFDSLFVTTVEWAKLPADGAVRWIPVALEGRNASDRR